MAETDNIMRMAELISNEIFSEFLWKRSAPKNTNWACKKPAHGKATHPSDVVFYYDEPYQNVRTYIQCDLKSYKKDSIRAPQIKNSVVSLSQQVSCADESQEWHDLFAVDVNYQIYGLLFIYNNDRLYDREFSQYLPYIKQSDIDIAKKSKIFVFGPDQVYWLECVVGYISSNRGRGKLPARECCSYFYPETRIRKKVRPRSQHPATLEMLSSPWIIMKHSNKRQSIPSYIVFIRDEIDDDDIKSLHEYLRVYNVFEECGKLTIASRSSEGAKPAQIINLMNELFDLANKIPGEPEIDIEIEFEPIPEITSKINEIVIGMRND